MAEDRRKENRQQQAEAPGGVTRRHFLTSTGVGAVGLATVGTSASSASTDSNPVIEAGEMVPITLHINGHKHKLLVEPRWSLAHVLRESLGLTGTKLGCDRGECGACTVLMDDISRYACLTLAVEAEGIEITTLEGILDGEQLGPVQQAFREKDAFQCGYCTPGQIMAVEGLLRANPDPTLDEIRLGVSGNLCRCGAYPNIFKAARMAADLRSGKGGGS